MATYTITTDDLGLHRALVGLQDRDSIDETETQFQMYIESIWYFLDFLEDDLLNARYDQLEDLEAVLKSKLITLRQHIEDKKARN